ncbi:MAG TPA: glycosyltransferase family 4 protein [Usitatibacter sp.]
MQPSAVLHIASLHGGGVDRHLRDLARTVPRAHLLWHVSPRADVLELPARERFLPLDRDALAREPEALDRYLRHERVGLVHAHATTREARERAAATARRLKLPIVATLHDILFLRPDGLDPAAPRAPDPAWLAQTSAFLREAAAVLAPSDYIAGLAREHVPGLEVQVVPNGSPPRRAAPAPAETRPQFAARRPRHVVAVLGAIGPHKGSAVLDALGPLLAAHGIAVVVVGYLDAQVPPGWRNEGLFVHGAYQDDEVPALLRAYGARLALFPNRVPESFSYALSDLWDAGLPVLVPPEGALGERVRRHGGGWLLPERAGAGAIAAELRRLLDPANGAELARVESDLARADDARVPRLDTMARSLDALYARFAIDPALPVDAQAPSVQALLARNLDGALFREEVARLADELVQLRDGLDAERAKAREFETEARGWIAKLEEDVARLDAELGKEVEARRRFAEENAQLRDSRAALELLPALLRRLLLKKVRDARG